MHFQKENNKSYVRSLSSQMETPNRTQLSHFVDSIPGRFISRVYTLYPLKKGENEKWNKFLCDQLFCERN